MSLFPDKEINALDELLHAIGTYRNSKDLNELFDFIKRFSKTVPFNAFLFHIQKPRSKYIASISEWKEKFNPGSRPLVILWSFAPVKFVFEWGTAL